MVTRCLFGKSRRPCRQFGLGDHCPRRLGGFWGALGVVLVLVAGCTGADRATPDRRTATAATSATSAMSGSGAGSTSSRAATSAATASAPGSQRPAPPPPRQLWRTTGFTPSGQSVVFARTAVVYGFIGKQWNLIGIDLADGSVRWRKPADRPADAGQLPDVQTDGSQVTFLQPAGENSLWRSQLVSVDPDTGHATAVSAPWAFVSDAGCAGTCYQVASPDDLTDTSARRLELTSAKLVEVKGSDRLSDWLPVRRGITLRFAGQAAEIAVERDGKLLPAQRITLPRWYHGERRLQALITARADNIQALTLLPGNVSDRGTSNLADSMTVAIDTTSGKRLWTAPGEAMCGGFVVQDAARVVTCRSSGTRKVTTAGAINRSDTSYQHQRTVVRGRDPRTGKVQWNYDAGANSGIDLAGVGLNVIDDRRVLVTRDDGRAVVLDSDTGTTTPAPAGQVSWCMAIRRFETAQPVWTDGRRADRIEGSETWQTCDAAGTAVTAPPNSAPPGPISAPATVNGRPAAVVTGPDAVVAYSTDAEPAAAAPTSSADAAPSPSATAAAPSPATTVGPPKISTAPAAAWRAELRPVTPVDELGGVLVYYGVADNSNLYLVGLDPKTGNEKWRQPATTSGLHPDNSLTIQTFRGYVSYFQPADQPLHGIPALLDPRTGAALPVGGPLEYWNIPRACSDTPTKLCVEGRVDGSWRSIELADRISKPLPGADDAAAADPQQIDLTWTDKGVSGTRAGKPVWNRNWRQLLGTDAAEVQYLIWDGWQLSSDTAIATVRYNWAAGPSGDYPRLDVRRNLMTVAITLSTGAVRWRKPAAAFGCLYRLLDVGRLPDGSRTVLLCTYTGTLGAAVGKTDTKDLSVPRDQQVTVHQVDPVTGKPYWSTELGAAPDLGTVTGPSDLGWLDSWRILLSSNAKPVVLNLLTGATSPAPRGVLAWCTGTSTFDTGTAYPQDGVANTFRTGGELTRPCTPGASTTKAPPRMPSWVGLDVSVGGGATLRVVAQPDAVVAYRVPRP